MSKKMKYAAALIPWAGAGDRFLASGYREALPVRDRILKAAGLGILDGLELRYPSEVNPETASDILSILDDTGLALSALAVPISGESIFGKGTLTARDRRVRQTAVRRVKEGMDLCAHLGGDRVIFFLGQDGCDYAFQVDFEDAWNWMVECLGEIASYRQDIKVCVEYKPFEPRRHIFYANVGSALYLMERVDAANLGVLFDTGHAFLAGETLGESVYLLHRENRLFYVHFNDNYRGFDDDLVVGSVHFLPFLEAVYWLKRVDYQGWVSLDLFPYREDAEVSVKQSIQFLKEIDAMVDAYGMEAMTELVRRGDGALASQELYRWLFSGKGSR